MRNLNTAYKTAMINNLAANTATITFANAYGAGGLSSGQTFSVLGQPYDPFKPIYPTQQEHKPVTNDTIRVVDNSGFFKDFDNADAKANEEAAFEYADERADSTRAAVRLMRAFAVVTPERKTKVTKL